MNTQGITRTLATLAIATCLTASACSSGSSPQAGVDKNGVVTIMVGQRPKLVLPDRTLQPLSVMLPAIRDNVQINLFMAGLLISVVLPVVIFLLFQQYLIRGAGLAGGIKG